MLRDSLASNGAGRHVEQVEIRFSRPLSARLVVAAWDATVAATEALRTGFFPYGPADPGEMEIHAGNLPERWDAWLRADRERPLLVPGISPWRVSFWPSAGCIMWTFHHALLDGRSITRVTRGFLERLAGRQAEPLALARWPEPTPDGLAVAEVYFRGSFAGLAPMPAEDSGPAADESGPAVRALRADFADRFDFPGVSVPAVLTWAWGQALAEFSGADAVMIEQLRAGAPQPGTAGFTMNTLPVMIHRAAPRDARASVRELRALLLAAREFENVAPENFPPGVFPDTNAQGTSVVMIERGPFAHLAGNELAAVLRLHEAPGHALAANAHIQPDLRLQVEGPERRELLNRWVRALVDFQSAPNITASRS